MIHLKADTSIESHRSTTALHVVVNQVPHHIGFFLYLAAYSNDLASTFWGYIKPCTPQLVHFYCVKVNNEAHSETRSCKEHAKHFNFFQERLGSTTTAMFPCVSVTEFNQHSINTAVTAWHTDWNKTHTHNQTHTHIHIHTHCCWGVQLLLYVLSNKRAPFQCIESHDEAHSSHNHQNAVSQAGFRGECVLQILLSWHVLRPLLLPGWLRPSLRFTLQDWFICPEYIRQQTRVHKTSANNTVSAKYIPPLALIIPLPHGLSLGDSLIWEWVSFFPGIFSYIKLGPGYVEWMEAAHTESVGHVRGRQ